MLIPLKQILEKYNIKVSGVIHVGAHWAEEHGDYINCGIKEFVYIEPCKEAFDILKLKFTYPSEFSTGLENYVSLFNCACGSEEKEDVMYTSGNNQGQSNSLLKPMLHLQQHPEVVFDDAEAVKVIPLDMLPIQKEKYNLLVMDCQGYEGEILKGATETLKHIDIIYTEINTGETYENNMLVTDMDKFLEPFGFVRVETFLPSPNWTWGDAIFVKR